MRRASFSGLVVLICLCSVGCDSGSENAPNDNDFDLPNDIDSGLPIDPDFELPENCPNGCYHLTATSTSRQILYEGTVTAYQPDDGYINLGPERDLGPDIPIASLTITIPESCFTAEAIFNGVCDAATFSFYSIGKPGEPLGAQEAYQYEENESFPDRVDDIKIGILGFGIFFIEGTATAEFFRLPPVLGDFVPETVFVHGTFTAKQAGT